MPQGDDPLFILGNGNSINVRSNAFEVSQNGHSIVFDDNGTGGVNKIPYGNPSRVNTPSERQMIGATYLDNTIYAWGDIEYHDSSSNYPNFVEIHGDFGVIYAKWLRTGVYRVEIKPMDPHGSFATIRQLTQASITVTPVDDVTDDDAIPSRFAYATTSPLKYDAGNQVNYFIVRTYSSCFDPPGGAVQSLCVPYDHRFMFKVTGR